MTKQLFRQPPFPARQFGSNWFQQGDFSAIATAILAILGAND
jgi:hypothetical protein